MRRFTGGERARPHGLPRVPLARPAESLRLDPASSSAGWLPVLDGAGSCYLPIPLVHLHDVEDAGADAWRGELLAAREVDDAHPLWTISPSASPRRRRDRPAGGASLAMPGGAAT